MGGEPHAARGYSRALAVSVDPNRRAMRVCSKRKGASVSRLNPPSVSDIGLVHDPRRRLFAISASLTPGGFLLLG
jgi:hypothetical protein